ncbi:MAG TPA: endolytic transglycosylase MltG [Spirochaetia bacterium]|nr:endolytic transglycosylase MltG [Spirochaetales bacterium]HRS64289.1 endolytic transglycosylase MltG [Spirochaetia bacterium]HOT58317.1 endolytic transglycosylase MltG [Spirochaetales bacterium]HPD80078.1 endolytic transglycosylase MltG [Spirochaetales bacterium]HQG39584.1 endolytic transglycosylase MltG [Spirochaetales bacterium]
MKKNKNPRGILNSIFTTIIFVFVLIGALFVGLLFLIQYFDAPTAPEMHKEILFSVESGESGASVTRRLYDANLIRSPYFFKLLLKFKNAENAIKIGTYKFSTEMKSSEILSVLLEGKELLLRVQIPEGSSTSKIALLLQEQKIISADDFLRTVSDPAVAKEFDIPANSLTGYLFPDTYYFPLNSSSKLVIETMVNNFKIKLRELIPQAQFLTPEELHERVILASIVEREYRKPEEAPLIAGVFMNRLKIRMPLQSCATVVYIITEELHKKHPTRLFETDLQLKSPYNTYLNPGLPPGPICNPGVIALQAAITPEPSRYLYFRLVNEKDGKHYFSETYDEHIRAAQLFTKGQ